MAQYQLNYSGSEINQLLAKISVLESKLNTLQTTVNNIDTSSIQSELNTVKQQVQSINDELDTKDTTISNIQAKLTELENSINSLSNSIDSKDAQVLADSKAYTDEQILKVSAGGSIDLGGYAKKTDLPTRTSQLTNDSNFISSVPEEYVTEQELAAKGFATETFVTNKIAEASLSGGEVDLNAYVRKEDVPTFEIYKKQKDYLLEGTKYYKTLISVKGSISTNTSYDAVVINNFNVGTYTVSGRIRQIYVFDGEVGGTCTLLEKIYDASATIYKNTFTVSQAGTLVINFYKDNIDNSVLVEGGEVIDRENEVLIPDLSLNDKLKKDIETKIIDAPLSITVTENKYIAIQSNFGSGTLIQNVRYDESLKNGCFNLVNTRVIDVIGEGNKLIHEVTDAITPIRTYWTLGANHGHPGFTLTVTDKSQADVGSVWTDGTTDYVMVAYDNNKVTFAYPYTFNYNITGHNKVNPTTTLTHKSGATHTSDIAIDSLTEIDSIYKSINKHSVKFFVDDNEISLVDGTYSGSTFIVKEEYNIVDYKAMQEYLKTNVGSMCNDDNIEGTLRVSLIYKFIDNGACTVYYSIKALANKVKLQNCGFVQSEMLTKLKDYGINRMLPGVKEKSGINFGKLVDMSSYSTSLVFNKDDLIDPEQPCNRSIDIITDSGGNYVIGHTIGYICDKFDGSDKDRLSNTTTLWDMRSTKKSYPIGISNVTLQPGEYLSFACFRNYISPNDLQNKVIVNKVIEDDCIYVIIDSAEAISSSYEIKELLGKKISIINSRNFTLDYDYVDAKGINYTIGENGGSAVLKVFNCNEPIKTSQLINDAGYVSNTVVDEKVASAFTKEIPKANILSIVLGNYEIKYNSTDDTLDFLFNGVIDEPVVPPTTNDYVTAGLSLYIDASDVATQGSIRDITGKQTIVNHGVSTTLDNNCLNFVASESDYIDCGFKPNLTQWSAEFYFYFTNMPTGAETVLGWGASGNRTAIGFWGTNFMIAITDNVEHKITSTVPTSLTHIILTYNNNGTIIAYKNGVKSQVATGANTMTSQAGNLMIGTKYSASAEFGNIHLKSLRFYDGKVLTDEEALQNYNYEINRNDGIIKPTWTDNMKLDTNTGLETAADKNACTNFISYDNSYNYTLTIDTVTFFRVYYYDSSQSYIKNDSIADNFNGVINPPENTAYMRLKLNRQTVEFADINNHVILRKTLK